MMCYKDITFCSAFSNGKCENKQCANALTEEEITKAVQWWGDVDFPVAMANFAPSCEWYNSEFDEGLEV